MPAEQIVQLLAGYKRLHELYAQLETVSGEVASILAGGGQPSDLPGLLENNKRLAEDITAESATIAEMKRNCIEGGLLSEQDRASIRNLESRISGTLQRIVDRSEETNTVLKTRGVKLVRK